MAFAIDHKCASMQGNLSAIGTAEIECVIILERDNHLTRMTDVTAFALFAHQQQIRFSNIAHPIVLRSNTLFAGAVVKSDFAFIRDTSHAVPTIPIDRFVNGSQHQDSRAMSDTNGNSDERSNGVWNRLSPLQIR